MRKKKYKHNPTLSIISRKSTPPAHTSNLIPRNNNAQIQTIIRQNCFPTTNDPIISHRQLHNNMNKILTIAICITTIIHTHQTKEPFTNNKLENTGIFFEEIGQIAFFYKQIKLVSKIDIPETEELTTLLLNCNEHLKTLCEEVLTKNPTDLCKPFRKEIKWHILQIQRQQNKLKIMYGRQKRGLIDIGGKISKFVFGTMDNEDSDIIYESLKNLENGQNQLLELEKQQVMVVQSNFEALTKPITELQNETYEIEQKLNELIIKSNQQNEFFERQNQLNHQVSELSSLILGQCLHVTRLQDEATEIILAIEGKVLHPLVIPFPKLTEIIKDIQEDQNKKMDEHEIIKQLANVEHIETKGRLIVKITIPILGREEFTLRKPYLLPIKMNQGYISYNTNTEYIATNEDNTKAIEMNTKEIENCKTISTDSDQKLLICQHTQPILSSTSSHCIVNMYINPLIARKDCDIIPAHPTNSLVKLTSMNTWLYSIQKTTTIIITCGNHTETLQLLGEGTLKFMTSCKVSTKDFTINVTGDEKTVKIQQPKFLEPLNDTSEDINHTTNNKPPKSMQPLKLMEHYNHNERFLEETHRISHMKDTINRIEQNRVQNNIKRTSDTLIISISISTTIVVILIIIITYKKCTRIRYKPTTVEMKEYKKNKTKARGNHSNETDENQGVEII